MAGYLGTSLPHWTPLDSVHRVAGLKPGPCSLKLLTLEQGSAWGSDVSTIYPRPTMCQGHDGHTLIQPLQQFCGLDTVVIPSLQIRKLRPREVRTAAHLVTQLVRSRTRMWTQEFYAKIQALGTKHGRSFIHPHRGDLGFSWTPC